MLWVDYHYQKCQKMSQSQDNLYFSLSHRSFSWSTNYISSTESLDSQNFLLTKVLYFIRNGWPKLVQIRQIWSHTLRDSWELTELDRCIIWCSWALIPSQAQEHILAELNGGHPGSARMKSSACRFVWWLGMDQHIEETVKSCPECRHSQPSPPVALLCPWQWLTWPWSCIYIDFAGPMDNHTFLVIIDAHSKWIEVFSMNSTTSTANIQVFRTTFSWYDLPESIVSNNGPQFTSSEFAQFCHF